VTDLCESGVMLYPSASASAGSEPPRPGKGVDRATAKYGHLLTRAQVSLRPAIRAASFGSSAAVKPCSASEAARTLRAM
jgi:hypothetical protein